MQIKLRFTLFIILLSSIAFAFTENNMPGRKGAHSRRTWSKAFIGVSAGASIPTADFAKADTIQGSGFAKIGMSFNLTAGIKLMPYLGIMATVGAAVSPFDASAFGNLQSTPGITLTYSANSYFIGQYMAGPFLYYSDGEKFDVILRTVGGLASVKFPIISANSSSSSYTQASTIETPSALSFGYDLGLGVNFKIANHIGLLVNADYFGTKVTYKDQKTTTDIDFFLSNIKTNSTSVDSNTYGQVIGLLQITAGVSINF